MTYRLVLKPHYPYDLILERASGRLEAKVLDCESRQTVFLGESTGNDYSVLFTNVSSNTGTFWVEAEGDLVTVNGQPGKRRRDTKSYE